LDFAFAVAFGICEYLNREVEQYPLRPYSYSREQLAALRRATKQQRSVTDKSMKKVTIYSTPTCVYCRMAKDFFQKNGIAYEEHNVAIDEKAREEMFAKSRQMGVPVIDVGGEIIVGFDKKTLTDLLLPEKK
jgi:glutaredoxin-like YruB-family protein